MLKSKDKDLKSIQIFKKKNKTHITNRGITVGLQTYQQQSWKPKHIWTVIFKVLRELTISLEFYTQISFKNKGKIKTI